MMSVLLKRRIAILSVVLGLIAVSAIVLVVTGWGWWLVDTCTWRIMVTFKIPVSPVDDYRIVVDKSDHLLSFYQGEELLRLYPVAISSRGLGARHRYDDCLTPEGEFLIASMQYSSIFGPRQMLLETSSQALADYRAQYGGDAEEWIREWELGHGPLDTIWEVYDYNEAHPSREIWHDILIHGGGSGHDWTLGCIALDDNDVLELFALLQRSRNRGIGVPVTIER
jgi:hypothetical protein